MKLSGIGRHTHQLPWRVCGVALLLALGTGTALAQERLSWPNHPPYVRVFDGENTMHMPVAAAQVAQQRLQDLPPEGWGMALSPTTRFAGHSQRLVTLYNADAGGQVTFLATPRSRNLLNDQNVACLDQVLDRAGHDLVASGLDDPDKRRVYLVSADRLAHGISYILDDQFVSWYFTGGDQARWLRGREKSADALLRFCHNAVVTRQGAEVTFIYNVVRENGSVVQRAIHTRIVGRRLKLLRLEAVEQQPAGTYSFPVLINQVSPRSQSLFGNVLALEALLSCLEVSCQTSATILNLLSRA